MKGAGGGGGPNFGSERTGEFFVENFFSQRQPRVSQCVKAGRRFREKYCFASRGERIIGGYPKTITFFNIPGIQFSGKMQRAFYLKITQPVKK